MRDIVRLKTERELVRVKIHDGNASWNEIGVNAGVSKLILLSLNLLLSVLVYAARHLLTAVRHKLMLPGITYYCWFLATAKAKTVNEERQIQALIDKKKVIITEKSVRSDLMLEYAEGTKCLPNDVIFEQLTLTDAKTTACNDFSSTMASAIISPEDMGEDLAAPTDSHFTPIVPQPSSSKPQKKKSRRKQRKDNGPTEPIPDEATNEEPISTPSCDPPQSGEDRLQLVELMTLCTKLQKQVLDLEEAKTAQAKEIVGLASRVESFNDVSLGAQKDASKQGRKIVDLDADAEVTLIDETQERYDEEILVVQEEACRAAIIEELDSIQAMIDADEQLDARLQAEEQEQFSIEEKSRMLVEMIAKRKKFFAAQRAAEQRSKPPTKNQIRNRMCTYLKNMGGYKHNQLKGRSYEEIQELFDKAYKHVSSFVPMDSEVVKSSVTRTKGSSKRAGDELESDKSKKQKIDEHVEAKKDDQEEAEMKRHIEIVKDDEVAIDAIPLATKPPVIVEYKIDKDGRMGYFKLIRADGSSKRPEEDYERVLWGDLKVMFELDIKSEVWRNLQGYKVTIWKLFDNCGVHFVKFKNLHIFMLVEKRYPITPITITNMLNKKLQADHWNEMCYQLLKLMTKQEKGQ
ncbi:hypothetical protein Tco_1267350 [Tanacetum coccineum]